MAIPSALKSVRIHSRLFGLALSLIVAAPGALQAADRPTLPPSPALNTVPAKPARLSAAAWDSIMRQVQRELYGAEPDKTGVLQAYNQGQRLSLAFSPEGPKINAAKKSVGLEFKLLGYGRGSVLTAVAPVAPVAEKNRVEYRHGSVVEWYVNQPRGLEQGFTLAAPPARGAAGSAEPLRLEIGVRTSLAAKPSADGGLVFADAAGKNHFGFGGFTARDASGRLLPARMEIVQSAPAVRNASVRVALVVDDRSARYPVVLDPTLISLETEISANYQLVYGSPSYLGSSVALSGDGKTLIIGVPDGNGGGVSQAGIAMIFTLSSGAWQLQAEITGNKVAQYNFGTAVALDSNGQVALVGEDNATVTSVTNAGDVLVFALTNGAWAKQATLVPADPQQGASFGSELALSSDGTIALISSYNAGSSNGPPPGAAYIFKNTSGTTWAQEAKLVDPTGGSGAFGLGVALSGTTGTGEIALIGAPAENDGSGGSIALGGAVYSFVSNSTGTAWTPAGALPLPAGLSAGANYGWGVALSSDGLTALIGAPNIYPQSQGVSGAAYVVSYNGSTWGTPVALAPPANLPANGSFGAFVAISGTTGTGQVALVADCYGDPFVTGNNNGTITPPGPGAGSAYLYTFGSGAWTEQSQIVAADTSAEDGFGMAVALNSAGTEAIVGAPFSSPNSVDQEGSAYVFTPGTASPAWSAPVQSIEITGANENQIQGTAGGFGTSVAMASDTEIALGIPAAVAKGAPGTGEVLLFTLSAGAWSEVAKLTAGDATPGANFGISVGISGGGTVVVGANEPGTGKGEAYVFPYNAGTGAYSQQGVPLVASDGATGNGFGASVAISNDGKTVLVGSPGTASGSNSGAGNAYVFTYSSPNWVQGAEFAAGDASAGAAFGSAVAISGTSGIGQIAVIGAPTAAAAAGEAYIYSSMNSGSTSWEPSQAALTAGNAAANANFGGAVAISEDASTILIGAPATSSAGASTGQAYAFTLSSGSYTQAASQSGVSNGDGFGGSLALSGNGQVALIGSPTYNRSEILQQGTVYAYNLGVGGGGSYGFTEAGFNFNPMPSQAHALIGTSVAMSTDGTQGVAGAPNAYSGGMIANGGVAYVLSLSSVTVTSATSYPGIVNEGFSYQAAASGGTGSYTFSITGGTLPAGLSLNASTGLISGTPTATGNSTVTLLATDTNGNTGSESLAISIFAVGITSKLNVIAVDNNTFSYQLTASESGYSGTYTYSIINGTLPTGLTLNGSTGVISGTPTATGSTTVSVQVSDGTNTGSALLTITVNTVGVTSATSANAIQNYAFSYQIVAAGGTTPYTYAAATSLPAGLSLNTASGLISGTPTTLGSTKFSFTVTDHNGNTAQGSVTINVKVIGITSALSVSAIENNIFTYTINGAGGSGTYTYGLTGSLPSGLTFNSSTGQITGNATVLGTFNVTLNLTDANDSSNTASATLTITVNTVGFISASSVAGINGVAFSFSLSASGGTSPYTYQMTGGSLPTGLTLTGSTGIISGTPSVTGSFNVTLKVTDSASHSATATLTIKINTVGVTNNISGTIDGFLNTAFTYQLNPAGGTGPYTFSLVNGNSSLPAGLTFNTSSGLINGTPTALGFATPAITVTDSASHTTQFSLSMNILTMGITSATTASGSTGTSFNYQITVSGGTSPYTYSTSGPSLPAGLTLNTSSGLISGTPTQSGSTTLTLHVTDHVTNTAQQSLQISIITALSFTGSSSPSGIVNSFFNYQPTTNGGTSPYTYSLTSGTLPAGLTLNTSTGQISGTPTAAGSSPVTIQVTDHVGATATLSPTIVINIVGITSASSVSGVNGAAFNFSVFANGGTTPYTFSLAGGSLPTGLTLAANGSITGTPTVTGGPTTATIMVTDHVGNTSTAPLAITINTVGITNSTQSSVNGFLNVAFNYQLNGAGGTGSYTYTLAGGSLPAGLALASNGAITGTPTTLGNSSATFMIADSNNVSSQTALNFAISTMGITSAQSASATSGTSFDYQTTVAGGTSPYTYAITGGTLPTGLTLNSDGSITGTPTVTGGFFVTLKVTDNVGNTAQINLGINVANAVVPLSFTGASSASGIVNSFFTYQPMTSGGTSPYTYALTIGTLPAGLTLNTSTGQISGTPTAAGSSPLTIQVTDHLGNTAAVSPTIVINVVGITSASSFSGVNGVAFNFSVFASGGTSPYTFSLAGGSLPTGLTLSPNGSITGTPTVTGGPTNATIMVTDHVGNTSTAPLAITINTVGLSNNTQLPINGYLTAEFSYQLFGAGGSGSYTYSIGSGSLPPGLTLSTGGGHAYITGIPTQIGFTTVGITVTDSNNISSQTSLSFSIAAIGITSSQSATGYVGVSFYYNIAVSGGTSPFTYSLLSGTLPPSLTLNSNGSITGTPSQTGGYFVTLKVTDSASNTATLNLGININNALGITGSSTANGTVATALTPFQVSANGGLSPYTFSISAGSLPAGLTLNTSTGQITGTPTAVASGTITITVTDSASNTANLNVGLTVGQGTPVITWPQPIAINVGSAISGAQLDATAANAVGTALAGNFAYTPASGTVMSSSGPQTLSVLFTPTDTTDYTIALDLVSLQVNAAGAPIFTTQPTPQTVIAYGTTTFSAVATGTPTPSIQWQISTVPGGSTFTNLSDGGGISGSSTPTLTLTNVTSASNGYLYMAVATSAGVSSNSNAVALTVTKAAAPVVFTGGSLNQTYTGSPLAATAASTPSGLSLVITYTGTAGTTYGPTTTAPTAAGSYAVNAVVNDSNYQGSAAGTLVISKATATVSLTSGSLTQTYTGTSLSAAATTGPSGLSLVFTYTGTSGTTYGPTTTAPTGAGAYTVNAVISDPNYQGSSTGTLNISKAAATVTLTSGSLTQTYTGAPLAAGTTVSPSGLTLAVTYTGTGSTTYGPSTTAPTSAGTYTVNATVSDPNYQGSASGTLVINPAAATVTLTVGSLSQTYTGAPLAALATTNPSGLPVNFTYTGTGSTTYGPSSSAPTAAGTYSVNAVVGNPNYSGITANTLTIAKATPVITWATPASIASGTALSSTQLNATTPVAGTFVYSPLSGTVPAAGTDTLSTTFTPTDAVDYNSATASVSLLVTAPPAITSEPPGALIDTLGSTVELTVAVTGSPAPTFQWYLAGQALANGTQPNGSVVTGATSAALTVAGVQSANLGNYTVVATNSVNHATSTATAVSSSLGYYFSTLAGTSPVGYTNGAGGVAQFNLPFGSAVDTNGNLYVADENNFVIRKLTPAVVGAVPTTWTVSTFAGVPGTAGSADGTTTTATFNDAGAITFDSHGNLFVADQYKTGGTIREISTTGQVSTIAGTPGVIGSADGTGSAIQFNGPGQLAFDSAGNLYVTDEFNETVRMLTPATNGSGVVTWTSTTIAGLPGATGTVNGVGSAARFNEPAGVAVDPGTGVVYVAERLNFAVRALTPTNNSGTITWTVSTLAGQPGTAGSLDATGTSARFEGPFYVTLQGTGSSGTLYVCDGVDDTVRTVALSNGLVTTVAGDPLFSGFHDGTGTGVLFGEPYSITLDGQGNAFIVDGVDQLVREMVLSTHTVTTIAGIVGGVDASGTAARFENPRGVAVDSTGNIYVADTFEESIRKITPAGVVTTIAGQNGIPGSADGTGSAAGFDIPYGVAVDSAGNVYIADSGNNTIRFMTPGGVVTTIAGLAHNAGSANGVGSAARFNSPRALAVDSAGNIYVADTNSSTIREIVPTSSGGPITWTVSTISGLAGTVGTANGNISTARYNHPAGIACDGNGDLYIADSTNFLIRKLVVSGGAVSTVAGTGATGDVDGEGPIALLDDPIGIAVDSNQNIYFSDYLGQVVRVISASSGAVSTLAGQFTTLGNANGAGTAASFRDPSGLAVDASGNLYLVDYLNSEVKKGVPAVTPSITTPPAAQSVVFGGNATFTAVAAGSPAPGYVWQVSTNGGTSFANLTDGNGIAGSATATLTIASPSVSSNGYLYRVVVTNPLSSVTSGAVALAVSQAVPVVTWATPAPIPNGTALSSTQLDATASTAGTFAYTPAAGTVLPLGSQALSVTFTPTDTTDFTSATAQVFINVAPTNDLTDMSTRLTVGGGAYDGFATFTVEGSQSKQMLIRGVGPALAVFGFPGTLADPYLSVTNQAGTVVASNDNWDTPSANGTAVTTADAAVGALSLTSTASLDAALVSTFAPGTYTVHLSGNSGDTGLALLEMYTDDSNPRVPYMSTRANVGTGSSAPAFGFTVSGTASHTFLVRALGPALGIAGTIGQPVLTLVNASQTTIATDTGWGTAASSPAIVAAENTAGLQLLADGSADSAVLVTLAPGNYTVQITDAANVGGITLCEIAEVDAARATKAAPALVSQTQNLTVTALQNATLAVVGTGVPTPTYQWQLNGNSILGATSPVLTLPSVPVSSSGNIYTVVATNAYGTATSLPATLTVTPVPVTITLTAGSLNPTYTGSPLPVAFTTTPSGVTLGFTYTGTGATTYGPTSTAPTQAGTYAVAAAPTSANYSGSASGTLTIAKATPIVTWAAPASIASGTALSSTQLDATASVAGALVYSPASGATPAAGTDTLSVTFTPTDTTDYTTATGSVSLLVTSAPAFTVGPPSALLDILGATIELSVTASGSPAPSFQWYLGTQALANGIQANGATIAGATSAALTVTDVQSGDLGNYTVVATNSTSNATSTATAVSSSLGYYFSTLAGMSPIGYTNGAGSSAQFNMPFGSAMDTAGNLYVADENNFVIRKLTPTVVNGVATSWTVSTFAGVPGTAGSADGTVTTATFNDAGAIAFDSHGNLFVSDQYKNGGTIREIATNGQVSTIAGTPGVTGSADGTGSAIKFDGPGQLAFDSAGNLYVTDEFNETVRLLTPTTVGGTTTWTSTTIAGLPGTIGTANGMGSAARFDEPDGLAVDQGTGVVYVAERLNFAIRALTPTTSNGVTTWTSTTLAGLPGSNSAGSADGTTTARFEGPFFMALQGSGPSGTLYVCDGVDDTIRTVALSNGLVTTVAGVPQHSGFRDGSGTVAGTAPLFGEPYSITLDGAGNAYVVDGVDELVRQMVLSSNTVTTIAGIIGGVDGSGSGARLENPLDVAVDSTGNLYVADTYDYAIRRESGGVVSPFAGQYGVPGSANGAGSAATFNLPEGLTVDPAGNVYVADTANDAIRMITPAGVVSTLAGTIGTIGSTNGTGTAALFRQPESVAYGPANGGTVYVADTGNNIIRQIVVSSGVVSTLAGTAGPGSFANGTGTAARFNKPQHVVYDGQGNIYVADSNNNIIRKIVISSGVVSTAAGLQETGLGNAVDGAATTVAQFDDPIGLAADTNGNVYVADTHSEMIRVISSSGTVTSLAGSFLATGSTDGAGAAALFHFPVGIAVDPYGNLYVADEDNNEIREGSLASAPAIAPQPTAQTITFGGTATFTAPASGSPNPTYQWQVSTNGGTSFSNLSDVNGISGSGTSTLSIAGATVANTGNLYQLVATNAISSATSNAVALTVNPAPATVTLTTGTLSQSYTGSPAAVTASVSPSGLALALTYTGTGGTTYATSATAPTAVGTYTVAATVTDPDYTGSASGTLTIAPVLPGVPTGVSAVAGNGQAIVTFTAPTATGGVSLTGYTVTATPTAGTPVTATGTSSPITVTGLVNGVAYTVTVAAINSAGTGSASAASAATPSQAPSFTTQPIAPTITYGGTATLTAVASGSPAPTYRWQVSTNGGTSFSNLSDVNGISGSATTTLTITGATVANTGTLYQLVATNLAASVASNAVALTVSPAPATVTLTPATLNQTYTGSPLPVTATTNPSGLALAITYSAVVATGNGATGISSAGGRGESSRAAGSASGSTTAPATAGVYTVTATVTDPDYTGSAVGILTINQATSVITWTPPATIPTLTPLSATQLNATANTVGTFVYTPAAGTEFESTGGVALGVTFTPTDAVDYTTASAMASITVIQVVPIISVQPASQTVNSGTTVTFTVTAAGTAPFTFQWQQNGNPITSGVVSTGATSTLTLTNVGSANAGSYNVLVTNGYGQVTSSTATLTVNLTGTPPAITQGLATQTVNTGANVTFTVTATGTAPLAFAWSQNGAPITTGVTSIGGTSTLTLPSVTTAASGSYSVAVSNGLGTAPSSASLTVNPAVLAPVIVSGSTAAGSLGSPFAYTIVAANNPTSFSASSLPAGLTVNTSSGAITGTPTAGGTFSVTLGAANAGGTGNATLALTILLPVPVVNSSAVATGRVGVTFAGYTITASNSPTSFGATGLAASGLVINGAAISGAPTTAGTYTVGLTATNASGTSAVFPLTLTILPSLNVPVISSPSTASGTAKMPFTPYTIVASNTPTSFAATGLPAGLTLDPVAGVISGTPTVSGVFTVLVTASNTPGTSPALQLTITIASAATAPVIMSNLGAGATFGTPFSYTITASNTPASFSATGLPSGLTLNGAVISGTPGAAGTFDVTIGATNASGTGTATLVLTIAPGFSVPMISSSSQASGQVGSSFQYTILANNTPTAFGATGLPNGLTLSPASGVISGTPAVAGTFTVQLTASNAAGTGQAFTLTLTIASAAQAPAITSAATASGTVGVLFSYTITTTISATSFAATGLPTGLALNPVTGVISGTPGAAGTTNVSITASNATGSSTPLTLIIAIQPGTQSPAITSSITASGTQGQAFSYTVTASNMPASIPLPAGDTYGATGLPVGLGINPSTGLISGTPGSVGTTSVILTATNNGLTSAPVILTLTINPAPNAPSITSGNTAGAAVGSAFAYQIAATPAAAKLVAVGSPAWLGINTATGLLAGTPSGAPGTYTVQLTATNATGTSAPLTLTITVGAASGTPVVTSTDAPPAATAGTAYADTAAGALYQIGVQPSTQIQNYFVNGGLPAGLNLDPSFGLISGTPTVPGTYTLSVGAANLIGIGSSTTVTLVINAAAGTPQISNTGGSNSSALSRGGVSEDGIPTASGTVGAAFTYQIQATGTPTSYGATNLPAGLAVNPTTGVITGIPTTAGTFTAQVSASNGIGIGASTNLVITISPPAAAPTVTSAPTSTGTAGTAYSYQMAASNTPTSYNAAGLPAGLSLNSSTGLISGTATVPGVYTVSLSANNASGTGPVLSLTLTVGAAAGAPAITSVSTASGTVGAAFTAYQVTASNGPITAYSAINLPAGLAIDPVAGAITGTPSTAGTFTATLIATNAAGPSSPFALVVTVAPAATSSTVTSATTAGTTVGTAFTYQIAATNSPTSYNVTGLPTGLTVNPITGLITGSVAAAGSYPVTISVNNATGTGATFTLTISILNPAAYARLTNLSARSYVSGGSSVLIAGFEIGGSGTKQLLLRGVGPGMGTTFPSITNALGNAQLTLFDGETAPKVIASNNGWANAPVLGNSPVSATIVDATASLMSSLGAFPYVANSLDAALETTTPVGGFSSQISGVNGATGVALAEIYDTDTSQTPAARLVNISARAQVGTGFNVLIAGFAISGNTSETLLLRGVGPALSPTFGLQGALVNAYLQLFDSNGIEIAANTGWSNGPVLGTSPVVAVVQPATTALMNSLGAFTLLPNSGDSAMEVTLPPGNYTAELSGVDGTTGIGLIELYEVP